MTFQLFFLTSSDAKFFNARHWAKDFDIEIRRTPWYGKTYDEPRTLNRERLLSASLQNARKRMKSERAFFIEDTSVRIDALSDDNKEVPGLEVKYWMHEMDFDTLDKMLKTQGGDRTVVVRSDIVLYLPSEQGMDKDGESIRFTSQTEGYVADREFEIVTNSLSPWLDSKTFNKWFVPKACDRPISLLPQREADKYDFRRNALLEMFALLEERGLINKKLSSAEYKPPIIQSLFAKSLVLAVGLPCAGKTTLGNALRNLGYFHLEASDFMRASYYERHGFVDSPGIQRFAEEALRTDPGIVTRSIIEELKTLPAYIDYIVVTGFRSPLELRELEATPDFNFDIHPIYIQANEGLRFIRAKNRDNLSDGDMTFFRMRDVTQNEMGLAEFYVYLKDLTINNESSIQRLLNNALTLLPSTKGDIEINENSDVNLLKEINRPDSLEDAILISLFVKNESEFRTTTQIAHLINDIFLSGIKTSKNNVSRYFNQKYYPYYELSLIESTMHYRLSATGKSKATLRMFQIVDNITVKNV